MTDSILLKSSMYLTKAYDHLTNIFVVHTLVFLWLSWLEDLLEGFEKLKSIVIPKQIM